MRTPSLVALALVLAGCASPEAGPSEPAGGPSEAPARAFRAPVAVSTDAPGSEPSLAVASDGTLFLQGAGATRSPDLPAPPFRATVNVLWRSVNDGATWEEVGPGGRARASTSDGWVAVGNGDRVYLANAFETTLVLFRSDDLGDTWTELRPPAPLRIHRMWVVPEGERTVHVAVEGLFPNLGLYHLRSDDLGATWRPPVVVEAGNGFGAALAVDAEGVLYAPRLTLEFRGERPELDTGVFTLRRSTDGGLTWEVLPMFALAGRLAGSWPVLVAASDRLHLVWAEVVEGTAAVLRSVSDDGGETWSVPAPVSPSAGMQTLPWAAARGDGAVGVAWYASDVPGVPDDVDAEWHVDFALLHGDAPRTARASDAPVRVGRVCSTGAFCAAQEDRDLADFLGVAFGPDGRAHVAFASSQWDEPSAFPLHAAERRS